MKIGVDAKWLFTGHISGRLFIQNLLPELINLYPEVEWHLFLDKNDRRRELPFPHKKLKLHYVWSRFNMLSNLFILPRLAKKLELDTVLFQTFSPKPGTFKSAVFIHDVLFREYPQFFTWKERLYFQPLKWTAPTATRIITTTEFVKSELKKFHYAKKDQPIDLAPSGVTSIFKPLEQLDQELVMRVKKKFNLPGSYLLFVGRLNARKNIEKLALSLAAVNDKNIPLIIAGEKQGKSSRLNHLLNDESIRSRIQFTGFVTDEELSVIYAMATIFCFPSFAEGFGLPPLEAMASGVPVIVSNTTSMPEACGDAAMYADPSDPASIAKKINELLSNRSVYDKKIADGLGWSKKYTWKRTAELIMKSLMDSFIEKPEIVEKMK